MIAPELRESMRFRPRDAKVHLMPGGGTVPTGFRPENGELPVRDVSTTGLCFTTPSPLNPGDQFHLALRAVHLSLPLSLLCEVAWCRADDEGRFFVGVKFLSIKEEERSRLEMLPGWVELERIHIDPDLAGHIPSALALRRRMVPFSFHNNTLHVAMADPNDGTALDALKRVARGGLKVYQADENDVIAAARMLYAADRTGPQAEDDHQAVAFLNDLVRNALIRRASDIHLEPQPPSRVRYRVDGRLVAGPRMGDALYLALVSRIKVLSGLDIAERRESQDGRMTWSNRDTAVDMRVATIPTVHGEHVTMRLLGGHQGPTALENLGMLQRDLEIFKEAISTPYGMILLTGPTGCGKSTTLYAALEAIKNPEMHILSVEDPVERRIEGISQVQVDQADKVGFTSALRSLLRHDPDVIMIGEIRDDLSLDVALKSALTGHLVFSSLHTNDATSASARLLHMKAPAYLVAATLNLVVAQRLVRRLCPECKRPGILDARAARFLGLEAGQSIKMPGGCLACGGSGYIGRMGIFELMVATEHLRELIVGGASAGKIRAAALEEGMQSLRGDGAVKVAAGLTDPGEILKAAAGTIDTLAGGG